jgi:hypothetical protein
VRQYDQGGLQSPITNVVQITLKVNAHSRWAERFPEGDRKIEVAVNEARAFCSTGTLQSAWDRELGFSGKLHFDQCHPIDTENTFPSFYAALHLHLSRSSPCNFFSCKGEPLSAWHVESMPSIRGLVTLVGGLKLRLQSRLHLNAFLLC